MTPKVLETCRDSLQTAYRERLGLSFCDSLENETGRQPVWRYVSSDDLITDTQPGAQGAFGLLLDPEIGLLYYLAPFDSGTELRKQMASAGAVLARLSNNQTPGADKIGQSGGRDPRGEWHIVLHWLVKANDWSMWTGQVAELRRETGISDDISLDALCLHGSADLESQIAGHGFPRLLFVTREVLRKKQLRELTSWMTADDLVRRSLSGFAARFEQPEQRELAEGLVQAMHSFEGSSSKNTDRAVPAQLLRSIRAQNFRNLRDVALDFGTAEVSAEIIHGPNGTGKSSLCEALSIALFGSSARYAAFTDRAREKDVPGVDRTREYLTKYITPLTEPRDEPRIAINEPAALLPPQLVPPAEAAIAETAMGGTILMQETSREFAGMLSQELGARVLRGYSDLADHLDQYAETRLAEANSNRQDFLRSFGLSASITKLTTAFERIARRQLDRLLPGVPRALLEWLETIPAGEQVAWNWREWGDEPARNALASRLSFLDGSPSSMREEVRSWLEAFNALVLQSAQVVRSIEARMAPLLDELDQVAVRIIAWSQWLQRGPRRPGVPASAEGANLASRLAALEAERSGIVAQGQQVSRHFDHLEGVETYLKESWVTDKAATCPTCGADHRASGGIQAVVRSLRSQTAAQRDELRARYSVLKRQIEELQRSLAELGEAQCPVSQAEQARFSDSLGWTIPQGKTFEEWITVETQRDQLLALITALRQKPTVPTGIDSDSEADRFTRELLSQCQNARRMFEAPANWKPVRDRLTATLAEIVKTHLPRTTAALWAELYLNLTSASWLLPDRPAIDVTSKRGEQRSTVQISNRLARHILNQAEVHALGLAWFLSRHFTEGRFSHACLIMDDPAQEMDETSFRELCRFWQTILRLHRLWKRPLRLVITLGQESRAVQAARTTGGRLWTLGWTPEQKGSIRPVAVPHEGEEPAHATTWEPTGPKSGGF